jgi:serine/threonine-protein kinase
MSQLFRSRIETTPFGAVAVDNGPSVPASKATASEAGLEDLHDAGPVLGRYELLMRIGAGGMGTVWAARLRGTRGFQKIVALKTILPRYCADAKYERMFLDEATLAARIRHPNVAQILDLGEDNGLLFLAMEWIDGVALDSWLGANHAPIEVPLAVAIRVAMQAASGLHAAHELRDRNGSLVGLVHGDVSPHNLVISLDGVTKVVDFGLARLAGRSADSAQGGELRGKCAYLAPEQINGRPVDRRADLFCLGIVLYRMTTGIHPFQGATAAATLYNIAGPDRPMPPSELVADYPRELEAVVMRCLEKDPSRRFSTGDELVWALDSSMPAELRATDQDVAVLARLVADEIGSRSWRNLDGAVSPHPSSPTPAREYLLTANETPRTQPSREESTKRGLRQILVNAFTLVAALFGTTGLLLLATALWDMASRRRHPPAMDVDSQSPVAALDVQPWSERPHGESSASAPTAVATRTSSPQRPARPRDRTVMRRSPGALR